MRRSFPLEALRTWSAYTPDVEPWLEVDDARLWRIRDGSTSGMLAMRAKSERTVRAESTSQSQIIIRELPTVTDRDDPGQISTYACGRRSRARCFGSHEKSMRIRYKFFYHRPTHGRAVHILASNFWTVYASVDDGKTLYTVWLRVSA